MMLKKITLSSLALVTIALLSTGCLPKKETQEQVSKQEILPKQVQQNYTKPIPEIKKYDLYSSTPFEIPLFSIVEISKLPIEIKTQIDKMLEESQGFYLLRYDGEKVFIILQNPILDSNTYQRHELQFAEIHKDGKVTYHNAGYVGFAGEIESNIDSEKDNWIFDKNSEPFRPLKHIVYDENKKVKFVEIWNYEEKNPIKYQMTDAHKKVVSILKEVQETDTNYRKEHIFYDNDGHIKMSLTINYDGANISRLTFFNSHDSIDSISIMSEYENGVKVKELIFNNEYKLLNTIISEYKDDERKCIKVYDSNGNEVDKINS